MKKNVLVISLAAILCLTGCGKKVTGIENARTNKNNVICSRSKELDYRDVEALREQEKGTYVEGSMNVVNEDSELKEKMNTKVGTYKQEYVYEFNDKGTKVEKIYLIITSTFTHEDVTDNLLEANKTYLENYYKNSNDYSDYKITIDGKSVIRELTINMDKVKSQDDFKISKQELINKYSITNPNEEFSITCKAN